ncbi:MAG: hypothetical protein AB1486_26495 [Planctomycetota bacterium]
MTAITEQALLKRILDLHDQLGALRRRIGDEEVSETNLRKLRRESRRKIDEIARGIEALPVTGLFGALVRRYKLNKLHVVIVLALLKRRLTEESPYMKGRELLSLVTDSSYEMLKELSLLSPAGPLISTGVVIPDQTSTEEKEDVLETPLKLSDRAFRLIYSIFAPKRTIQVGPFKTTERPYPSNLAYVMDYRRLALLYQKRASKVFNFEYWDDLGLGVSESTTTLNNQIARYREKIQGCLAKTGDRGRLHLANFAKEFSLDEEQVVILVTLLFQELTEGSSYLDVVDLLKLVSRSEEDLVRRRRMFSARDPLIQNGLVVIEEMVHDKPLTGEAYLPAWVAEKMLTGRAREDRIDTDSQIHFHQFLEGLDSSDKFYEGLDDG